MCSCKLLAAKRCACCTPPHASSCHVTRGGCLPLLTTTRARVACQHSRFELVSSRVRGMLGVLWCRCFLSVMVQSPPSPPRYCGLLLACRQRAAVASSRLRGCRDAAARALAHLVAAAQGGRKKRHGMRMGRSRTAPPVTALHSTLPDHMLPTWRGRSGSYDCTGSVPWHLHINSEPFPS